MYGHNFTHLILFNIHSCFCTHTTFPQAWRLAMGSQDYAGSMLGASEIRLITMDAVTRETAQNTMFSEFQWIYKYNCLKH